MIEKSNIIKKLEEYFTAKDEVFLAYLFGSVAKGESNRLSDVDVTPTDHRTLRIYPLEYVRTLVLLQM